MKGFNDLFGGVARRVRAAKLQSELERLSDRDLADIGLNRGDVARGARDWSQR